MKKIIALILCTVLLCGCNKDSGEKTNSDNLPAKTTTAADKTTEKADEVIADVPEKEDNTDGNETEDDIPQVEENGFLKYDLEKAMNNVKIHGNEKVSFLNPEQQEAFDKAYYVSLMLDMNAQYFWGGINTNPDHTKDTVEGTYCLRSGYSYDSVLSELCSVLDEKIVKSYEGQIFCNADGEFAMGEGARGANVTFKSITFVPEPTKNDPDVIFKGTASYGDPDGDEISYTEDYIFRMEKTKNGWKFTEFPLWL